MSYQVPVKMAFSANTKACTVTDQRQFSVRVADEGERLYFAQGIRNPPSGSASFIVTTKIPAIHAATYACSRYDRLPSGIPDSLRTYIEKPKDTIRIPSEEKSAVSLYCRLLGSATKHLASEGKVAFQEQNWRGHKQQAKLTLHKFDDRIDFERSLLERL